MIEEEQTNIEAFEPCWVILELFGHQKMAGRLSEATIASGSFLRLDVPECDGNAAFTRFYGPKAVYSFTPVSEEVARLALSRIRPEPVTVWIPNLERLLQAPTVEQESPHAYEEEPEEDDPRDWLTF